MSCGNPSIDGEALMERRQTFDRARDCLKCKINKGNIVIRHVVYCKECFSPIITQKFRRVLAPLRKSIRRETPLGNLMVGLSGGLGSIVLLDLVYRCYFQPDDNQRGAQSWKKLIVCYVESCGMDENRRDQTEAVHSLVSKYPGVEFHPIKLEDAFTSPQLTTMDLGSESLPFSVNSQADLPTDNVTRLRKYLSSLPTQTAISSTIATLIRVLLSNAAASNDCSHLFLGTSLTSLAVNLISGISQGGGFNVPQEFTEECISLDENGTEKKLVLARPMRDIGAKECAAWAWWNDLEVVGNSESMPSAAQSRQNIATLTKDFIVGLEKDYPSTVSTITRTCAKLSPKKGHHTRQCTICQRPCQSDAQEWKERISIRAMDPHSHSQSTHPPNSLTPLLCYACHTTLRSRSSRGSTASIGSRLVPLPFWSSEKLVAGDIIVPRLLDREEQRAQISEFLI